MVEMAVSVSALSVPCRRTKNHLNQTRRGGGLQGGFVFCVLVSFMSPRRMSERTEQSYNKNKDNERLNYIVVSMDVTAVILASSTA